MPPPFKSFTLFDAPNLYSNPSNWLWDTYIPAHYYNFWYAMEGSGTLTTENKTYPIKPGTAFLLPPHQKVFATPDKKAQVVNFAAHIIPFPKNCFKEADPHKYFGVETLDIALMHSMAEFCAMYGKSPNEQAQATVQTTFHAMFQLFWQSAHSEGTSSIEYRIHKVITEIEKNPAIHWNVDIIAKRIGLSRSQTNVRFQQVTGTSPKSFIVNQRMRRAKDLLRQSPMSIDAIAEALGYRDVFFFSRQFKKLTGTPPSTYRRDSEN